MREKEPLDLPRIVFQLLAIGVLIASCFWILRPFLAALAWATMIVVATWPVLLRLQAALGGRRSLAVAAMTVVLLLVLIAPLYFGIAAIVENARQIAGWAGSVTSLTLPQPPAWLADVPLIGAKLAERWQQIVAANGDQIAARVAPYGHTLVVWFVGQIGGVGLLLVQFLLTVIIAAMLYSNGEAAARAAERFARRLAGERGEEAVHLAASAVRAVALGVVVTAILQALFTGLGLVAVAVPFAAILSVVTFILAVAQIGALPVLFPAVLWVYARSGGAWGTGFLLWAVFCSTFDNFLRPFLIKRGAHLPLALIFVGVVGGLVGFGVIGLFIGPVVLAVAYTLIVDWVEQEPT
jgi:predicted PurR-regulated permease PerM